MALNWDFARVLSTSSVSGNTTSFLDEKTQAFYLKDGQIKSQNGQLVLGQWGDLVRDPEISLSDVGYSSIDVAHPYNNNVFITAQHNNNVVILLHEYRLDMTDWSVSGSLELYPDNAVRQGIFVVKNATEHKFLNDAPFLYSAGSNIKFYYSYGESEPICLGYFLIEESLYSENTDTYTFKGRNPIGFYLLQQTFDEHISYTGTRTDIITQMLTDAGVETSLITVESDLTELTVTFDCEKVFFEGFYETISLFGWRFVDNVDGRIIVGTDSFVSDNTSRPLKRACTLGTKLVKKTNSRKNNRSYNRVCIRRQGVTPLSIYADVPYYSGLTTFPHRTFYKDVPDSMTQEEMEALKNRLIAGIQNTGVIEEFDSEFVPDLKIGDVYTTSDTGTSGLHGIDEGIVFNIKHSFDVNGIFSNFKVTSGGTITNINDPANIKTEYIDYPSVQGESQDNSIEETSIADLPVIVEHAWKRLT